MIDRRGPGIHNVLTVSATRRLAKDARVRRIMASLYRVLRAEGQRFLEDSLTYAVVYATHARRSTITPTTMLTALRRMGAVNTPLT